MFAIPRGSINHLIIDDIKTLAKSLISKDSCKRADAKTKHLTEKYIENYFLGSEAQIMPFARTAFHSILASLNIDKKQTILMTPFNISPMLNIIESLGFNVDFVDINLTDFGPSYEDLKIKLSKKPSCFFLTYLFGYIPNLDYIVELCKENNVILIEDISQNIGAKYKGKLLGSFGKASIYSASLTKYVDGYNGGFVISKNKSLIRKIKSYSKNLNQPDPNRIRKIILKTLIWNIALNPQVFNLFTYKLLQLINLISPSYLKKMLGASIKLERVKKLPKYYFEDISNLQCNAIIKYLSCLDNLIDKRYRYVERLLKATNTELDTKKSLNNRSNSIFWQYLIKVDNTENTKKLLFNNKIETGTTNLPNLAKSCGIMLKNAEQLKNNHLFIPLHDFLQSNDYIKILSIINKSNKINNN